MKVILTIILSFFLISSVNAQYLKDDRYPNWDNKLTGKLNFPTYRAHQKPAGTRFLADATYAAVEPFRAISVLGGRPTGCPARAWCGCWLARYLGLHDRNLWLARNWARIGSPTAPSPGAVVVFARGRGGHVGKITEVSGNRIKVLSGNDGRMVRERWRTMAGVIAVRRI